MELLLVLSAVQTAMSKLNIDAVTTGGDVYNVSFRQGEVSLQGRYSSDLAAKIITAHFNDFMQMPISDNGFVSFKFTLDGLNFTIALT